MSVDSQVVERALAWVDTPHRHGASQRGIGSDCLGLVRGVYREVYGLSQDPERVPNYRPSWKENTEADILLSVAYRYFDLSEDPSAPGRLLIFRMRPSGPVKHCGISIGDDKFVHTYSPHAVGISHLEERWTSKIVGVFSWRL